jgi:hypothetical protein
MVLFSHFPPDLLAISLYKFLIISQGNMRSATLALFSVFIGSTTSHFRSHIITLVTEHISDFFINKKLYIWRTTPFLIACSLKVKFRRFIQETDHSPEGQVGVLCDNDSAIADKYTKKATDSNSDRTLKSCKRNWTLVLFRKLKAHDKYNS